MRSGPIFFRKEGLSALFMYMIWLAQATVFDGLIPVMVGRILTASNH